MRSIGVSNKIQNMSDWIYLLILGLVWFIFKFTIALQGFDLCDEGWVMCGYQQIFNDPSSVEYLFLYYTTQLVGGVWYLIFGNLGYLGFRVLGILTDIASIIVLYLLLRGYINKLAFAYGYLILMLLENYSMVFHHNHLTILLLAITIYFLIKGIREDRKWCIFGAGIVLGINCFSRLPNLSMTALSLLFLVEYWYNRQGKMVLTQFFCAIVGTLAGVAFIFIIISLLQQREVFFNALDIMLKASDASDSNHGLSYMFHVYINSYKLIFRYIVGLLLFGSSYALLCKFIKGNWLKALNVAIFTLCFIYFWRIRNQIDTIHLLYAISTLTICISYLFLNRKPIISYFRIAVLIVLYFLPLGSDFGIGNMGFSSLFVCLPIVCFIYYLLMNIEKQIWLRQSLIMVAALFFVVYTPSQLMNIKNYCYFDPGNRLEHIYKIDNKFATTYTSLGKVEEMNKLLTELDKYVKEDDYLFCYQNLATINYLTQTRPYVYNPWVWVYDSDTFRKQLERAREEIHLLPVVVREKCIPIGGDWMTPYFDFDNENVKDDYIVKKGRTIVMNKFLKENNYKVCWEDELFQILTPEPIHK